MSTELSSKEVLATYPDVMLTADVCEVLHVCRQKVYKLIDEGKLKTIPGERIHKFPKLFVMEYMLSYSRNQNEK